MFPDGQSTVVVASTDGTAALNVMISVVVIGPWTEALSVTVVVVVGAGDAATVVPAATPVPLTGIPALIPLVAAEPASVNVTPDEMLTVGDVVIAEFPEPNVIVSVVVTPPPDKPGGDSVTVVTVAT